MYQEHLKKSHVHYKKWEREQTPCVGNIIRFNGFIGLWCWVQVSDKYSTDQYSVRQEIENIPEVIHVPLHAPVVAAVKSATWSMQTLQNMHDLRQYIMLQSGVLNNITMSPC